MAIVMLLLYHLPRVVGLYTIPIPIQGFVCNAFHPFMYFFMVTGYGLFCAFKDGRLTWNYLWKRTLRLYITFWLVLAVFVFGFGWWMYPDRFPLAPDIVLANFVGWRWDYSQYTWFLLPYLMITMSTPLLFRCIEKLGYILSLVLSCMITLGMTWLIGKFYASFLCHHIVIYLFVLALQMIMGITAGAVIARYYLSGHELTWSKLRGKNLLVWPLLVVAFLLKGNPYINSIPYISVLIVWLILHFKPTWLSRYVLIPFGKQTMIMWLAHGFLGARLFTDYFMMLKWPVLVYIAWVLASYAVARLLMPVSDSISRALKLKR
jgi:hypothetical protein